MGNSNENASSSSANLSLGSLIVAATGHTVLRPVIERAAETISRTATQWVSETRATWHHCRLLSWNDLPEGPLHICQSSDPWAGSILNPCKQSHEAGEECWGSTLGQIFNRAWCEEEVIDCKPNDLMFEEYLKTDILTLLSYIAIGVVSHEMSVFNSNKWYTPERYNANDKSFVLRALATKIEFERREKNADKGHSILIAHVTGGFKHSLDDITAHLKPASLPKADMERILSGYPPYYRSEYVLRHRLPPGTREIILQDPIPSPQDRFRGGWIVAVGRTYAYPVAFYVDSQRHRPGGNFPHTIDASITRVRDILEHDIIPVFSPSDPLYGDVCAALEAVKRLMGGKTRSDLNRYWPKNGSVRGCISSLDQEVSNALIRLFNRFGPLTEEEKVLVKGPNTMAVLEVVVDGVATVVEYFKDRAVWLPSWWVDELKNESIYLRGCNSTEQASNRPQSPIQPL